MNTDSIEFLNRREFYISEIRYLVYKMHYLVPPGIFSDYLYPVKNSLQMYFKATSRSYQ